MGDGLILETTFLIDLEREHAVRTSARKGKGARRRQTLEPAHRFLASRSEERLYLTVTTAGELASGVAPEERSRWEGLIGSFGMLHIDLDVCWAYGRAYRYLADNGLLIDSNDLWIAATAVTNDLPLVTRNQRHFARVPGLRVVSYITG